MNSAKSAGLILLLIASQVSAHDSRLPEGTDWQGHEAEESTWLETLQNFVINPAEAAARISIEGNYRVIRSDGKPDHSTGRFPNRNNPNSIQARSKTYRVAANPVYKEQAYALGLWPFGVAINGVPFDPGAAEFWRRDRNSGWQYEALGGAVNLGVDRNNAHVQPDGTYHYHGIPFGLLEQFNHDSGPALLGYAADGFPIYGPLGYINPDDMNSRLVELRSSYQVKQGNRNGGPGGRYDGSFVQDYGYLEGLGDLDDCNGRFGVTPDYPEGTYYYVLTGQFPFIPRCFHGEPDRSFMRGGPGGMGNPGMMGGGRAGDMQGMGGRNGPPGRGGFSGQPSQSNRGGPMGGGPPEEAFTACIGRTEGEAVSFDTPHGHTVKGRCEQFNDGRLFAIPER